MSVDEQTGADATEGAAEAGKTFTQEQVDALIAKRLSRAMAPLQAKLAEYEQADEKRRQDAMTEQERLAETVRAAEARAAAAEQTAQAAEAARVRAELIAEKAADLPPVFRRLITGSTADEVDASIAAARTEYENLKTALGGPVTRSVGAGVAGTAPPPPAGAGPQADSRGMSPYERLMAQTGDADGK